MKRSLNDGARFRLLLPRTAGLSGDRRPFAATALHHDLMFVTRNDGDVSWIFLSYANRSCTTQAELTLGFVGRLKTCPTKPCDKIRKARK